MVFPECFLGAAIGFEKLKGVRRFQELLAHLSFSRMIHIFPKRRERRMNKKQCPIICFKKVSLHQLAPRRNGQFPINSRCVTGALLRIHRCLHFFGLVGKRIHFFRGMVGWNSL